jgi:hypothetical protein
MNSPVFEHPSPFVNPPAASAALTSVSEFHSWAMTSMFSELWTS